MRKNNGKFRACRLVLSENRVRSYTRTSAPVSTGFEEKNESFSFRPVDRNSDEIHPDLRLKNSAVTRGVPRREAQHREILSGVNACFQKKRIFRPPPSFCPVNMGFYRSPRSGVHGHMSLVIGHWSLEVRCSMFRVQCSP